MYVYIHVWNTATYYSLFGQTRNKVNITPNISFIEYLFSSRQRHKHVATNIL